MESIQVLVQTYFSDSERLGYFLFAAGIMILIIFLMRQLGERQRKNTERQRLRELAIRAAEEAQRKNEKLAVLPKAKVAVPPSRVPLADPFATPFTGAIQGNAAKWEAEIHKLGRQIVGQIDAKMAALQAITLDANRTANRLEILLEHLEELAQRQVEHQQAVQQQVQNNAQKNSPKNSNAAPAANDTSTVIPATAILPDAAPLTEVLKELATDLDGINKAIKQSTSLTGMPAPQGQATILKMEEMQSRSIRAEAEMLSNYGVDTQEIARRLNISPGEVDIILQVQQSRLDRTM